MDFNLWALFRMAPIVFKFNSAQWSIWNDWRIFPSSVEGGNRVHGPNSSLLMIDSLQGKRRKRRNQSSPVTVLCTPSVPQFPFIGRGKIIQPLALSLHPTWISEKHCGTWKEWPRSHKKLLITTPKRASSIIFAGWATIFSLLAVNKGREKNLLHPFRL